MVTRPLFVGALTLTQFGVGRELLQEDSALVAAERTFVFEKKTYEFCAGIGKFRHFLRKLSWKNRKFSQIFVDILKKVIIIRICMDTIKDCMIPECGDLEKLKNSKVVVGAKQLRKALEKGSARFVFLAQNADPAITEPLAALCLRNQISCAWVCSMHDLGRACGIDVGAAAAAAVD